MSYNPWGLSGLRRNWSLIPLVAIIGGGCGGAAAYVAYMIASKQDISFRPWRSLEDKPVAGVHDIRKLYNIHPPSVGDNSDPEIIALRREIGSFGMKK